MAVFHRLNIENKLNIDSLIDKKAVENESMSIVWPNAQRIILTVFKFVLFVVTAGFCCWGVSYLVTHIISKIL